MCYPSSVTSARAMMLFNLGSAYSLRSEYDKARKCLHQVISKDSCNISRKLWLKPFIRLSPHVLLKHYGPVCLCVVPAALSFHLVSRSGSPTKWNWCWRRLFLLFNWNGLRFVLNFQETLCYLKIWVHAHSSSIVVILIQALLHTDKHSYIYKNSSNIVLFASEATRQSVLVLMISEDLWEHMNS